MIEQSLFKQTSVSRASEQSLAPHLMSSKLGQSNAKRFCPLALSELLCLRSLEFYQVPPPPSSLLLASYLKSLGQYLPTPDWSLWWAKCPSIQSTRKGGGLGAPYCLHSLTHTRRNRLYLNWVELKARMCCHPETSLEYSFIFCNCPKQAPSALKSLIWHENMSDWKQWWNKWNHVSTLSLGQIHTFWEES